MRVPGTGGAQMIETDTETETCQGCFLRYSDLVRRNIVTNRTTLRRWMTRPDDPFPQAIYLGPNYIVWRATEVEAWIDRRSKGGAA